MSLLNLLNFKKHNTALETIFPHAGEFVPPVHTLTDTEILAKIQEDAKQGRRTSFFKNSRLPTALKEQLVQQGYTVFRDKDSDNLPRIVICW